MDFDEEIAAMKGADEEQVDAYSVNARSAEITIGVAYNFLEMLWKCVAKGESFRAELRYNAEAQTMRFATFKEKSDERCRTSAN